jgi:hypothetical protein
MTTAATIQSVPVCKLKLPPFGVAELDFEGDWLGVVVGCSVGEIVREGFSDGVGAAVVCSVGKMVADVVGWDVGECVGVVESVDEGDGDSKGAIVGVGT